MSEAEAYGEPARSMIRLGIERLTDYQDMAYARDYLARLKPIAAADTRRRDDSWPRPRASSRSAWPTRTPSASPS